LIEEMKTFPAYRAKAEVAELDIVQADKYYGKTYDDLQNRIPSVEKMDKLLGWKPKTDMNELIHKTVQWYAEQEK
ncbi:MAG: bifunctional UDP-4-keto-pentose/UDP-xylose synthase, partial [Candidatus Dojkabacteria bacterium]